MKDNAKTIIFSIILGLICSIMLTAASLLTAPYRTANEKAEMVRNYLAVLEVPVDEKATAQTLLDVFDKNVKMREIGNLTFYEYVPEGSAAGKLLAVAVPFSGPGLWAQIKGVIAFEPDLSTIRGIRFYQQEETPGLGGEIGSAWFQKQFKGKSIVSSDGNAGFSILKPGGSSDNNSVDGIAGATLTADRVQVMLDKLAKDVWKERDSYGR
ncbi:MAG: FMN-binding protein [Spirochaetota bacterium]